MDSARNLSDTTYTLAPVQSSWLADYLNLLGQLGRDLQNAVTANPKPRPRSEKMMSHPLISHTRPSSKKEGLGLRLIF